MAAGVAASADLVSLARDLAYAANIGINKAASDVLINAGNKLVSEAQLRAPVKTGALRGSIRMRVISPTHVIVGPNVDYAAYQEYGTGSRGEFPSSVYVIKPKTGKRVLSFTVNGRRVYTTKVQHPGVRPKRYMRNALQATLGPALAKQLADQGALLITKGPNANV